MLRLIATDLDGTLLRSDGTISDRTKAALARAREAGVTVVLVSARGPRGVAEIAEALTIDGLAICSNGAVMFDLATAEVIRHRPLAADVALRIALTLRERLPDVSFAAETELHIALEPTFTGAWGDWQPPHGTRYGDALELLAEPVTKLIARDAGRPVDELAAVVRDVAGEAAAVSFSGEWVVEICAAGVTKATALEELASDVGIDSRHVVAFGDYPNDLPMLAWAGFSVAPANAHPDVLAQVDHVTGSNDEDGVAIAVERLLAS